MKKYLISSLIIILSIIAGVVFIFTNQTKISNEYSTQRLVEPEISPTPTSVPLKTPPLSYTLPQSRFVSQTFNNCGPASLSMILSMFGRDVSQQELGDQMRPFNNPLGGIDDKSIFVNEYITYAEKYGFKALHRPNGTIDLLKKFVANDIPVIVRTWLNPTEDIGHFRIVRGYDSEKQTILQDDSYQGPNLTYAFDAFNQMWQPFNYGYIVIYPKEKQAVVDAILGEENDEKIALKNSIARAEKEVEVCQSRRDPQSQEILRSAQDDKKCAYAQFNLATANYHLGNYQQAVAWYEKAQQNLPPRMLWYQLEPMQAYLQTQQYDTVFQLTNSILYNGNLGYSELYQMRGEAYLAQGNQEAARREFEKAVYYNKNFLPAQEALKKLGI